MQTIFALATAPGKAGVAVIRVSGPAAYASLERLAGTVENARTAYLRALTDRNGDIIDQALVMAFEGPNSFTGEDVVEYQVHGSVAVTDALQVELALQDDHRRAEPGEFTRRALTNGKLDLTQVEGLADLIEAQTDAQRRQAQQVLDGSFASFVTSVRADVTRAAALLEATIDFADEDVPEDVTPEVVGLLERSINALQQQIEGFQFAERIRSGFEVAIIGAPNVGKSTLLNALAGRDAAITSHYAGTTRDVIEVQMDLDGIPITILDTAGIREAEDHVEQIGIQRAVDRAQAADMRLVLQEDDEGSLIDLSPDDLVLRAKMDVDDGSGSGVSGVTGVGLDRITDHLIKVFRERVQKASFATRQRHFDDMRRSLKLLTTAKKTLEFGADHYDIAAEELRSARHALGSIIGLIDVENLLDEIFTSFCLGK